MIIINFTRLLKLAVGSLLNEIDVNKSNCSIESKWDNVSLNSLANKIDSFDLVLLIVDALIKQQQKNTKMFIYMKEKMNTDIGNYQLQSPTRPSVTI